MPTSSVGGLSFFFVLSNPVSFLFHSICKFLLRITRTKGDLTCNPYVISKQMKDTGIAHVMKGHGMRGSAPVVALKVV